MNERIRIDSSLAPIKSRNYINLEAKVKNEKLNNYTAWVLAQAIFPGYSPNYSQCKAEYGDFLRFVFNQARNFAIDRSHSFAVNIRHETALKDVPELVESLIIQIPAEDSKVVGPTARFIASFFSTSRPKISETK